MDQASELRGRELVSVRVWLTAQLGLVGLCVCAMMGCAQEQAAVIPESLAPNWSFEMGEGDTPEGWSYYSWQASRGWWADENAHSGDRSLGLEGPNGGWSTDVDVEPGVVYSLNFYYRAGEVPCRTVVYVRHPIGDGKMANVIYKPMVATPYTQTGTFVDGEFLGGADEAGWALAEVGEFVAPAGVTELNLLIKLSSAEAGARAWVDDVVLTALEPREQPDTARVLRLFEGGVAWTEDVNRKILVDQATPEGEALEAIEIAAAGGEYESFQIALKPEADASDVTWTWGAFEGPGEMPEDALRCRRVEYVDIQQTRGPFGYKGLNPDALTEQLPCDVAAGTNQPFWFTVRVPAGQEPGEYEATLTLTSAGATLCRVPVRLRVRGFDIPRRPSIDIRSNFRWNLVLARESGDEEDVLRAYYRSFYEHRTRCMPGALVSVVVDGDAAEVEMETFIDHLRYMRDEFGMRRTNIPSLWIGHRGTHQMPPDAQWRGVAVFADAALTMLNPAFEAPFRDYMDQLLGRLRDEGLFLTPTVRFIDEPNLTHQPTVNGIRTLCELLKDIDSELQVAHTVSYPHPELLDVSDLWVLHTDSWNRNIANIAAARAAGNRISVYNNAVNLPDHKPIRVRLWPWLLKKYDVDGTYSWWGTVCWRGGMADPWTNGKGGSGVMLYPPRNADEIGPIESVRWELFREGLEDFEYMVMAEELAEKLEAAGKPEAAAQGREAVAGALALVDKWPNVKAANDEPYTFDVTKVAAAREALAAAIEAMRAE